MYENVYPAKRFRNTVEFLKKHISPDEKILDLGVKNPLSNILKSEGFTVTNTAGQDLDNDQMAFQDEDYTVVTAFEIFEHLLNPYTVMKSIKCNKIVISVPLRLWFSPAYQNKSDDWDKHFHEFEDWQLDWLLQKTGWKVIDRQKWTNPVKQFGIRPFLRLFTNRYYIVYAEKI